MDGAWPAPTQREKRRNVARARAARRVEAATPQKTV
jgi:hypothetical protein